MINLALEVLDVSSWPVAAPETAGDDEKVWLRDPAGVRWLFKPAIAHVGWRQGEDWAERISCDIARALDIPAATVELASRDGRFGCISRDLIPTNWELQSGAVKLSELVDQYESRTKDRVHANSLGFNLQDGARARLVSDGRVTDWPPKAGQYGSSIVRVRCRL
jgi:hypothetical protein